MSMKEKSTSALKAMLNKGSGADQKTVRQAIAELKRRGEETPPPALVMGGRAIEHPKAPPKRPKKPAMAYGGSVKGKKHNYAAGGMVKDNAGLRALKKASPEAYKKITGK